MDREDLFRQWREALLTEAPRAAEALRIGGQPLRAFALVTDDDLRTVNGAGYTLEGEQELEEQYEGAKLYPPEWREAGSELRRSSDLQSAYCDSWYSVEGSEIGPDDDYLRPWKQALAEAIGDVLVELRASGAFPDDCILLVWPTGASSLLEEWLNEASRRANPPGRYNAWQRGE
jgi:hypothetical protein